MGPDEIGIIATALFLIISEVLPFISKYEGNGVIHILSLLLKQIAQKQKYTQPTKNETREETEIS